MINHSDISDLWSSVFNGDIPNFLKKEMLLYEKTKQPDNYENFNTHFIHIEAASIKAASLTAKYLSSNVSMMDRYKELARTLFIQDREPCDFQRLIILPGAHSLANGAALKVLASSAAVLSPKVNAIVALSLDPKQSRDLESQANTQVFTFHDHILFVDRLVCLAVLSNISPNLKELMWWSAPCGMVYLMRLTKLLKSLSSEPHRQLINSWLTVKHNHSFSRECVDITYSSLPSMAGFSRNIATNIKQFDPSIYAMDLFLPSPYSTLPNPDPLYQKIHELKLNKCTLLSSVSREDKIVDPRYIIQIKKILELHSTAHLLVFGRQLPDEYKDLAKVFENRIIYCGWREDTNAIIGKLDLFLDPFPFGSGMTFVSAALNKVPIVSTSSFINETPSSIAFVYYNHINGRYPLTKPCEHMLLGDWETYHSRALSMLCNKTDLDIATSVKNTHEIVRKIFLNSSSKNNKNPLDETFSFLDQSQTAQT